MDSKAHAQALANSHARTGQLLSQTRRMRDVLHDIGSPISSIILYSELLLERETDPYAHERLGRIRDAAQKCHQIMQQAAALTRGGPLSPAPLSVAEVCADALAWMQPRLAADKVQVVTQIPPDLPPAIADHGVLLGALVTVLDLVCRASSATGEGATITLRAEYRQMAELPGGPGPAVRLTVQTAGQALGLLGTGQDAPDMGDDGLQWLGAKEAAAGQGGRLRAESRPEGGGTAFTLDIPAG